MISRRNTIVCGVSVLTGGLSACGKLSKIGLIGKKGLDNAGKPWSYKRANGMERFELHASDVCPGDHGVERSEVGIYRPASWREDIWLSYRVLLEQGPVRSVPWLIIGQWHAFKDPWDTDSDPPVALSVCGDRLKIKTVSDPHLRQQHNPPVVLRSDSPFQIGAWHHFVHRARFDPNGHGALQIWIDGALTVNANRIPLGLNDLIGPYFKYGLYRPVGDLNAVTAWYADVRLGDTSLLDWNAMRRHPAQPILRRIGGEAEPSMPLLA